MNSDVIASVVLAAEVQSLRAKLAALLRYEHGNSHAHSRVATWDRDNGPPVGNAPCARCHAFADAREALGMPRWPTAEEYHRAHNRCETRAEKVCAHDAACGCGGAVYADHLTVTITSPLPKVTP